MKQTTTENKEVVAFATIQPNGQLRLSSKGNVSWLNPTKSILATDDYMDDRRVAKIMGKKIILKSLLNNDEIEFYQSRKDKKVYVAFKLDKTVENPSQVEGVSTITQKVN